jgi:hypothetical protein
MMPEISLPRNPDFHCTLSFAGSLTAFDPHRGVCSRSEPALHRSNRQHQDDEAMTRLDLKLSLSRRARLDQTDRPERLTGQGAGTLDDGQAFKSLSSPDDQPAAVESTSSTH